MRTGEVAALAGVNVQTLRYYERRGLIAEPVRGPGGHRDYPGDTVSLLGLIKTAQGLGFTLDEVAGLLGAARRGRPGDRLRERVVAKLAEVDRRLAELAAVRETLARLVDAECDSLTDCTRPDCPLSAAP
ncbi:MerR family transcriptional regulator [Actinophytocola xanthii]|uniref:MerR family transcriptional regulator n=1 Tax=Actinophytocola xanthii TaxID=1912961 RepID=A0A1Q8CGK9_9PSEU|nr:MerR family transcriptional regulator [Actinophytocola xanthii]OLF13505.1 MerR family transcriptional regulator [Actinophytocola xanthii]